MESGFYFLQKIVAELLNDSTITVRDMHGLPSYEQGFMFFLLFINPFISFIRFVLAAFGFTRLESVHLVRNKIQQVALILNFYIYIYRQGQVN